MQKNISRYRLWPIGSGFHVIIMSRGCPQNNLRKNYFILLELSEAQKTLKLETENRSLVKLD